MAFTLAGDVWTAAFGSAGYQEQQLTFDGASRNPRWSPDGTMIAFNTPTGAIGVMSATGTGRRLLTARGLSFFPAWSPQRPGGAQIVFAQRPNWRTPSDIWAVPAGGGAARRLTDDGAANCGSTSPSWSSTGTHITYLRRPKDAAGVCQGARGGWC